MPTKNQHLEKSANNEALSGTLDPSQPAAIDWEITILFYVAVHYVEAYFSLSGKHHTGHKTRYSTIVRDQYISGISKDYEDMYNYSRDARYDSVAFTKADVQQIKPRLERIKKTIKPLLP